MIVKTTLMLGQCVASLLVLSAPPAKKPASPKPPADEASALLGKVQKFYDRTEDLSADFIQLYTRVALSRTIEQRGTVKIKKPGMMRWDYSRPTEKHFIADGKKLYVYEPEEEQVFIDPSFKAAELGSSIAFLWGKGRLADSFTAKLGDPKAHKLEDGMLALELTPKSDATYTKLILGVDPKTSQVLESVLHETAGNINHFKFRAIRTNTGVKSTDFDFVPPPNVEVIERP